ncbi:MAG: hypothetical protein AB7E47_12500 [Desulfovibrionaceae bacterium]
MHNTAQTPSAQTPAPSGVFEQLRSRGGVWHPIDAEDVTISNVAADALRLVASQVLAKFIPAASLTAFSSAETIALLANELYWHEETGRLFLCADLGRNQLCLPIPADHWDVRKSGEAH